MLQRYITKDHKFKVKIVHLVKNP